MSDTSELRDRIASLFRQPSGHERLGDQTPGEIADAVLAVLPAPVPAELCGSLSQPTYSGEIMRCVLPLGHPRQCQSTTEYPWVSWPSPSAEADLLVTAAHRLALSEALGLGTGAPWDAIRDRAAELRRLADEAQQPTPATTEPVYCGLCLYGSDVGVPGYDDKGPAYINPACPDHSRAATEETSR